MILSILWIIFYVGAAISIIAFLGKKKELFGSLVYGLIVSLFVSLVKLIFTHTFDLLLFGKILTVFILLGDLFIFLNWYDPKKSKRIKN
jgi:hypothetical protein